MGVTAGWRPALKIGERQKSKDGNFRNEKSFHSFVPEIITWNLKKEYW